MGYEAGAAFRTGLAGFKAGQAARTQRQQEEMDDIIIRGAKDAEGAHRAEMEERGMTPSDWGMRHPWMDKFLGGMTKGFGPGKLGRAKGAPMPISLTTSGGEPKAGLAIEPIDVGDYDMPMIPEESLDEEALAGFADGRRPRHALRFPDGTPGGISDEALRQLDEEVRARAARARAASAGNSKVISATETVAKPIKGATAGPKLPGLDRNVDVPGEGRVGGPGRVNRARRALDRAVNNSKVGRAAVPAALGLTAYKTYGTDTEDYRKRFGMELEEGEDPTLLGDMGVRALGAASELGSVLTGGLADYLYRDKQEPGGDEGTPVAPPAAPEAPAPAPTPTAPAPTTTAGAGGGTARASSRTALKRTEEGAPAEPKDMVDITKIDLSEARPEDIPDFQTRDWIAFREEATDMAVARGMPLAQAYEAANTQVQRMQQQSFNHFAQQAAQLLRAGNQTGAMAAIKAAYQMFPSGDDVQLGTYNGQIYGVTVDEETGKPTGQPTAITPESIYAMIDQSKKEGEWNKYAKDQRDFAFDQKQYDEVTRPASQAQIDALYSNSETARMNALTNRDESAARLSLAQQRAAAALQGGGLKASDMRASELAYRKRMEMLGFTDEQSMDDLASQMSMAKIMNPGAPDNLIMKLVLTQNGYYGGDEGEE